MTKKVIYKQICFSLSKLRTWENLTKNLVTFKRIKNKKFKCYWRSLIRLVRFLGGIQKKTVYRWRLPKNGGRGLGNLQA